MPQTGSYKLVEGKVGEGERLVKEVESLTCPVCLDVYNKPAKLPACSHVFCLKCIQRYAHKSDKHLCPLCRAGFNPKDILRDREKQGEVECSKGQCPACLKLVPLPKLRSHVSSCTVVQQTYRFTDRPIGSALFDITAALTQQQDSRHRHAAGRPHHHHHHHHHYHLHHHHHSPHHHHHHQHPRRQHSQQEVESSSSEENEMSGSREEMMLVNRHTFKCPACHEANMDLQDLRRHCMEKHSRIRQKMICPVCAVMPWFNPREKHSNIAQHLDTRHRFEYDTFVDFNLSEEEQLQRTIERSLHENSTMSEESTMSDHSNGAANSSFDSDYEDQNNSSTNHIVAVQTHI